MVFKEIEYNNPNRTTDKYEEVPQEELWEDGELSSTQVQHKILHHTMQQGDWILVRRVK